VLFHCFSFECFSFYFTAFIHFIPLPLFISFHFLFCSFSIQVFISFHCLYSFHLTSKYSFTSIVLIVLLNCSYSALKLLLHCT
ncbi:hypothetical protein LOTGIDRAFT_134228, partial [Lottia gigantea]